MHRSANEEDGVAPGATGRAGMSWVKTHAVVTFYMLAFAISWLGFVPMMASG